MKVDVELFDKCNDYDFKELFKRKGFAYFTTGKYNLNIIGVRNNNNVNSNEFNDFIVIDFKNDTNEPCRQVYQITTDPGYYYRKLPADIKGCAIMAEGQYRGAWKIGLHKGYKALVQCKPIKVYRDNNKNLNLDFDKTKIYNGIYGINIHKAGSNSELVDKWSAGCQVFKRTKDFNDFMKLCSKQIDNKLGIYFTYTLINSNEMV